MSAESRNRQAADRFLYERIRALEAELAEWREAKKFLGPKALDEWRSVVLRLKKAEAERDALKVRVAELEARR